MKDNLNGLRFPSPRQLSVCSSRHFIPVERMELSMKRKYEINLYAPFQYEDIQVHLEEMAERGWELEKASHRLFVYQAAEPGPVRYALAYRPEVGWMDQLPTQGQEIYADYCQDAGWELVDTWARYPQIQIYRSRMRYPVPLETDLTTHWQVLTAWMEKRYVEPLRSSVAITCLIAIFTAMLLTVFFTQGEFAPPLFAMCAVAAVLMAALVLNQLVVLVDAQRWMEEARRASEEGSPGPRGRMSLPWKLTTGLLAAAGVGTLAVFVGVSVSDHGLLAAVRIAGAALVFYVTLYAAFRFRDLLRKKGGSPHWKWIVFTIVAVLLALLDVGLRDWLTDF